MHYFAASAIVNYQCHICSVCFYCWFVVIDVGGDGESGSGGVYVG